MRSGCFGPKCIQERDVNVAIADPTRRKLLRLLAEANELPLHELTAQFQMVNIHLEQTGISNDQAAAGATYGLINRFGELEKVLEEM
nr:hypothetical protein [Bacillus sp. FJAT-29790]